MCKAPSNEHDCKLHRGVIYQVTPRGINENRSDEFSIQKILFYLNDSYYKPASFNSKLHSARCLLMNVPHPVKPSVLELSELYQELELFLNNTEQHRLAHILRD